MKTIKQIREDYDSRIFDQVDFLPEEIMLDEKDARLSSRIPSNKEMPLMIIFRRIQFRNFPGKQVVGLYYSKTMNKYLSIPFGPDGNVNLSEAVILEPETLDEDWQSVNRKDKTDGLSQKAVNAYRRENPGSKLKTAVTEKNPTGKRAARRKSFCSRMGGMKARLTSAKTARDPDSNINKALRRWNCEESFRLKLEEKRQIREFSAADAKEFALDSAPFVGTARSASRTKEAWKKGEYGKAAVEGGLTALGAAGDLALASGLGAGAGALAKGGVGALRAGARLGSKLLKGAATKATPRTMSKSLFTKGAKSTASKAAGNVAKKGFGNALKRGAGNLAKDALGAALDSGAAASGGTPRQSVFKIETPYGKTKSFSSSELAKNKSADTARSIEQQAFKRSAQATLSSQHNENTISDLRKMIDEDVKFFELPINGKLITLNNNMAKRIVEVYDSVNVKNKKIVEGMLNEDLESFKKLLNFSVKV